MKKKNRIVYFAVEDGEMDGEMDGLYGIALVTENEAGYHLAKEGTDIGGLFSEEDADLLVNAWNKRLKISKKDAAKIVASSMFAKTTKVEFAPVDKIEEYGHEVGEVLAAIADHGCARGP